MATFAFSGRTRTGQPVSGERVADSADALVAQLRREQIRVVKVDQVKSRDAAAAPKPAKAKGHERPHEEPGDLHPAVLGDDRRGVAAGAVPRHPGEAGSAQELLGDDPEDPRGRRERRVPGRRHAEAPARRSTRSTRTWSRPVRRAASSTRSSSGWPSTSKRTSG